LVTPVTVRNPKRKTTRSVRPKTARDRGGGSYQGFSGVPRDGGGEGINFRRGEGGWEGKNVTK